MLRALVPLAAALRLAACAQPSLSVFNDILAFPQFEVAFTDTFVTHEQAASLLKRRKDGSQPTGASSDLAYRERDEPVPPKHSPEDDSTYEYMTLHGQPYLCNVPLIAPEIPEPPTNSTDRAEAQKQELARASSHGWELLKDMQGTCMYYHAGWWVYSFCYNDGIKQFHALPPGPGVPIFPPTEDRNADSYVLGKFSTPFKEPASPRSKGNRDTNEDSANGLSTVQSQGETNYLVRRLGGGTKCDLTGHKRRIEVQFHCNPSTADHIHMIKETASCVYLMVVHTPRLCNDVVFHPPQADKPHPITCREILSEAEIPRWKQRKAAEFGLPESDALHEQEREQQQQTQHSPKIIVGGIEVGGQKLVGGPPERTIKASNIISGSNKRQGQDGSQQPLEQGEERWIGTLAKSDGRYVTRMEEPEMKKLGMKGSRKEVEQWIQKVQAAAGEGNAWTLDVVLTHEGMEFRGIVEDRVGSNEDNESGTEDVGSEEEYYDI